jgi:hypothetical protein
MGRLQEPRGRVRWLGEDERQRLLAACAASSNCLLLPVVVLALSTGARKQELLGLSWREKVYAVINASDDPSHVVSRTTLACFTQAGVIPTSANAVLSEIHRTWNRPEAAELA